MDHLPKIQKPCLELFQVPFLPDDRYTYDNLGLADFPLRLGITPEQMSTWEMTEASIVLQNWLYFGTLTEVA